MITRRTIAATIAVTPLIVAAGDSFASEAGGPVSGEVEMTLSSALRRQTMRYGDQVWTETRDRLPVDEGHPVRLSLINDTASSQTLRFAGPVFGHRRALKIAAGERAQLTLSAAVPGEGAILFGDCDSRAVEVRPSYFPHPIV